MPRLHHPSPSVPMWHTSTFDRSNLVPMAAMPWVQNASGDPTQPWWTQSVRLVFFPAFSFDP